MATRQNAWWTVPPLAISVVLGLTVGLWGVWVVYTVFNIVGVWLYSDFHGSRRLGRQLWIKRLAIVLLPVGYLGLLSTGGRGLSMGESVTIGSPDPEVRKNAARAGGATGFGGSPR